MSELIFTVDKLPARCEVIITFCGPILCANARNIDTGTNGPLVGINRTDPALRWADLDPDGSVAS